MLVANREALKSFFGGGISRKNRAIYYKMECRTDRYRYIDIDIYIYMSVQM